MNVCQKKIEIKKNSVYKPLYYFNYCFQFKKKKRRVRDQTSTELRCLLKLYPKDSLASCILTLTKSAL